MSFNNGTIGLPSFLNSLKKFKSLSSPYILFLVLYTDGITDAHNEDKEMYGEKELKRFFNNFTKKVNPLKYLLNDVDEFVGDCEQFDDMTLIYFKIKHD